MSAATTPRASVESGTRASPRVSISGDAVPVAKISPRVSLSRVYSPRALEAAAAADAAGVPASRRRKSSTVRKMLEPVKLKELVREKRYLVTINKTDSISNALKVLEEYGILSLPVVDDELSEEDRKIDPFIGVVDITDVLVYVAFGFFAKSSDDGKGTEKPWSPAEEEKKLESTKIGDLLGLAVETETGLWHNGLFLVRENDLLLDTIDMMFAGVQRVLVGSRKGYKCLSQIDVFHYLANRADDLEDVANLTVEAAGLLLHKDFNELCVIKENDKALDGFKKIVTGKADAVAIVDEEGRITGTLSPSDLRHLYSIEKSFSKVFLNVSDFQKEIHRGTVRPPVCVKKDTSILEVMDTCSFCKVHRAWVIDEEDRPIGCVRLQDIIVKFKYLPS